MKKLTLIMLLVFVLPVLAIAAPTTYSHTVDVLTIVDNYWWDGEAPIVASWEHSPLDNPYPGGSPAYDQALLDGLIYGATLTVVVDDLDFGNTASISFRDKDGNWHGLGHLNTMSFSDELGMAPGLGNGDDIVDGDGSHLISTTFVLDPYWLDGVAAGVQLNWVEFGGMNEAEIETATLSITGAAVRAPAPGSILLGSIGIALVGWLRRRRAL